MFAREIQPYQGPVLARPALLLLHNTILLFPRLPLPCEEYILIRHHMLYVVYDVFKQMQKLVIYNSTYILLNGRRRKINFIFDVLQ